jgi:hypothetical protein
LAGCRKIIKNYQNLSYWEIIKNYQNLSYWEIKMQIIKNLSYNEYDKMEGISNSKLNEIWKSPAHYKLSLEEKKETDALKFGSLLHCLVLEPNNFDRDFAVAPNIDKRSNANKEIHAIFEQENAGKTIVTQEQFELANILKDKIMEHEIARKLLTGKGENEIALFWEDEETKVKCKAKLDRIKNCIVIDLKTTRSAHPDDFMRGAYEYGYHRQSAWYSDGYEQCFKEQPKGFVFIAIETVPPYNIAIYEATELFKEIGKIEVRKNLQTYKTCKETNNWFGYEEQPTIHSLEPPKWVLNKYIEELNLEEFE